MARQGLTHFDSAGAARMVAIGAKQESPRFAVAVGRIRMAPPTLARVEAGTMGKGDVLAVARLAGIGAAKATAQLVPLCHPVRLTSVEVSFEILRDPAERPGIEARVEVHAVDRTGPEMEAMTAASVALLTIYDMCKAMDREMDIERVMLVEKAGGKSGHWARTG